METDPRGIRGWKHLLDSHIISSREAVLDQYTTERRKYLLIWDVRIIWYLSISDSNYLLLRFLVPGISVLEIHSLDLDIVHLIVSYGNVNDPRRGNTFPLCTVIGRLACFNFLYLQRGEYSSRMNQRTSLPRSTVHVLLVSMLLYWNLHSRHEVGITLLKSNSVWTWSIHFMLEDELQSRYKSMKWKLKTKKWEICWK